jgi:hypothetical protein
MLVKLFKDVADLFLLSSNSSAIAKNHLAELDNTVVVVFTEAKSAAASVALHGGVRAILFQMSFHLLAFNLRHLACVTDNQLFHTSLLVACFVRSSERSNATIVCAIDDAVLALGEQMVRKVSVLDSFNVAAFNGAVKGCTLEKLCLNGMQVVEGLKGCFAFLTGASVGSGVLACFTDKLGASTAVFGLNCNVVAVLAVGAGDEHRVGSGVGLAKTGLDVCPSGDFGCGSGH